MKSSLSLLKEYVRGVLSEVDLLPPEQDPHLGGISREPAQKPVSKFGPSKQYKKKEDVRAAVQSLIAKKVHSGAISKDEDLADYVSDEKTDSSRWQI